MMQSLDPAGNPTSIYRRPLSTVGEGVDMMGICPTPTCIWRTRTTRAPVPRRSQRRIMDTASPDTPAASNPAVGVSPWQAIHMAYLMAGTSGETDPLKPR